MLVASKCTVVRTGRILFINFEKDLFLLQMYGYLKSNSSCFFENVLYIFLKSIYTQNLNFQLYEQYLNPDSSPHPILE